MECEPSTNLAEARDNQVVSLLDRLVPPDSSDLSRKRKINVMIQEKVYIGHSFINTYISKH